MLDKNPFKYFKTSPEIIKLTMMYYVIFPLSLSQVKDNLSHLKTKQNFKKLRNQALVDWQNICAA